MSRNWYGRGDWLFLTSTTAYVHVSGRMGGPILFLIVNASLMLANIGSGMASQLGAARLLYAMGQDGALPGKFFAAMHPKTRIPRNNVLLIGAICLVGAMIFSYQLGTELLNYGALLAFMGVNLASMLRGWRHGRRAQWWPMVFSLAGLVTSHCYGSILVCWRGSSGAAGRRQEFFFGLCGDAIRFCLASPPRANLGLFGCRSGDRAGTSRVQAAQCPEPTSRSLRACDPVRADSDR